MICLLRVAMAIAYLAAAALPCPEADAKGTEPALLRTYAAGALHTHGAATVAHGGELRAPCVCGCDETPSGRLVSSPLGAALVPSQPLPALPRAAHRAAPTPRPSTRRALLPDPVPRLA